MIYVGVMAGVAERRGMTAVVTGASSGIGLHFCRHLAAMGVNVVMVSNEREPLEACAAALEADYGVTAWPLCADLAAPDADAVVMSFLDRRGIYADILINNAGIFSFSPVCDVADGKIDCFIGLHVRAVTLLSRAFASRMSASGRGGYILNMSSMSCWAPMPGLAMYSATKAYIRVFTRALHYEMRGSGVSVTAAVPGGIATDLFGLPGNLKRLAVRLGAIDTPESFTRKALKRMFAGRQQYINGLANRLGILLVGLTPTWGRMLVKRLMLDRGIRRP